MNKATKKKVIFSATAIGLLVVVVFFSCFSCNSESFEDAIRFGQADLQNGKYDDAIYHLKRAAELEPENAVNLLNLGVAYFKQEDYSAAADAFEKATQINPTAESFEAFAVSRYMQGRYDDAINIYSNAFVKCGRKSNLLAGQASCHMRLGNTKHALTLLQEAYNNNPNDPTTLYNMATLRADRNEYYEAANCFVRFYEFADPEADKPQLEQAHKRFEQISANYPKDKKKAAVDFFNKAVDSYKKGKRNNNADEIQNAFKNALYAIQQDPTEPTYTSIIILICKELKEKEMDKLSKDDSLINNLQDNVDRLTNRLQNGFPKYYKNLKK